MYVIVFPKRFEFWKFMVFNRNKVTIFRPVEIGNIKFDFVSMNFANNNVQRRDVEFICKLIHGSDIEFLLEFSQFMKDFKEFYKDTFSAFKFVIFGTCGSLDPFDRIGHAHLVTTAYKGDRGELISKEVERISGFADVSDPPRGTYVHNIFAVRNEKVIEVQPKYLVGGEAICSNNFLMKCQEPLIPNVLLYDMETFDFFKICDFYGANVGGAIRVVSDRCGEDEKTKRQVCSIEEGWKLLLGVMRTFQYHPILNGQPNLPRVNAADLLAYVCNPNEVRSIQTMLELGNVIQNHDVKASASERVDTIKLNLVREIVKHLPKVDQAQQAVRVVRAESDAELIAAVNDMIRSNPRYSTQVVQIEIVEEEPAAP